MMTFFSRGDAAKMLVTKSEKSIAWHSVNVHDEDG